MTTNCARFVNVAFEMRGEGRSKHVSSDQLHRTSELRRIIRRTSSIFRVVHNCRVKLEEREHGDITGAEEDRPLQFWIRHEQRKYYDIELSASSKKVAIPAKSQLLSFNPFVEQDTGMLRVGGRLRNSTIRSDAPDRLAGRESSCEVAYS